MTVRIIRWILTALLIVGVYSETGIWTALAIALLAVNSELVAATARLRREDDSV